MSSLTYLHLGQYWNLTMLPSLDGLTNLKSVTLVILPSVVEIPSQLSGLAKPQ